MTATVIQLRRPSPSPLDRAASALAATPGVQTAEARAMAVLCLVALAPAGPDHDEAVFASFTDDPAAARAVVEDWIMAVLS